MSSSTQKRTSRRTRRQKTPASTTMLAIGANPSLQLGRAPAHPAPVPVYSDKWVRRTYSASLSTAAPAQSVDFTAQLFGVPGAKFFVDKIQVWKVDPPGSAAVGIRATFKQGLFTDLGADDVAATDYGTASSLPGVTMKVPIGHAIGVAVDAGNMVTCVPITLAASGATVTYACHLTCFVSI